MIDDIQGWMDIDVIDENCIRLSHDLGWCHMTPEEVIVLTARLAEAVVTAMKIDGSKHNATAHRSFGEADGCDNPKKGD